MSLKQDIYAKIHTNTKSRGVFLFLLCSLLILAFVLPTWVIPIPYGTDVYTHLFMTRTLSSVNSLSHFYTYCLEKGYMMRYDYPFGLWLFGSIVAKITGMDMLELSRILPFAVMLILITLYFSYAKVFGISSDNEALLSVIFLLSMPLMSLGILGYSTSIFVRSFLIFILYLILVEKEKISSWKRTLLINVLIFTLCFTHTGTYMFLLMLTIAYLFIYAILCGELHRDSYMATGSIMFFYIITMHLFPYVHPQYIDKGRILVSAGDFLTSDLHVPFADELAQMFYKQIFLDLNPLYVVLACLALYATCRFLMFLHHKIKASGIKLKLSEKFLSIPIIGSIRHISHSVLYTPFWLGPVHTVLAISGIFKVNRKGLCMLFAVAAVTLIPGYMGGEAGTGALRKIEYFFIIVPPLAALGFYYGKEKIEPHMNDILRRSFAGALLLGIFSSVIVMPVVGNLYYHPLISGPEYERTGLSWLGHIGTSDEGCAGWGYRHMISVYGKKIPPAVTSVASGSEMRRYTQDQHSVCFNMNSEKHADDLYATFGVKYLIVSKRTIRNLGEKPEHLMIDHNRQLDKIYSSAGPFFIYKYVTHPVHRANIAPQLNFADDALIKDAGDSYLVETDYYKMRIGKTNPAIQYIGNKTINFLGDEGIYYDFIRICRGAGSQKEHVNGWALHEISFPAVILGKNEITYRTVLKDISNTENWATLTVKYTFFDRAMKREIILSNDWINDSIMNPDITMAYLSPMRYFSFRLDNEPAKKRTIYPSEDEVRLKNLRFNRMFINNGKDGIYNKFEITAPYPDEITYTGLINYSYYTVSMHLSESLLPSESMDVTQWISIGHEQAAEKNIERYSSVSLYPYPDGEIPVILVSRINSLNTSSEEDFDMTLNTHERFREAGVTGYTEAVRMRDAEINTSRMERLLEEGAYIIGCERVEGRNITVQAEEIKEIKENAAENYGIEIDGFMPKDLRYELDTVKVLSDRNLTFLVAKRIMPAFDIYFQEGLRHPELTYYRGDGTGVVLLPVSEPVIGGATYFYDDYKTAWKAVIDSVIKNEDSCVFLWDSEKACRPEYINETMSVIRYAKERGMNFTTPYEIAKHFLLLQNVSATVSRNDDGSKIIISVKNENKEAVRGVTFKVEVPGTAEYTVKNAKISRKTRSWDKCVCYVSTDLDPGEIKEIVLERE